MGIRKTLVALKWVSKYLFPWPNWMRKEGLFGGGKLKFILWDILFLKGIPLNKRQGRSSFLVFLLNITFYVCLVKSALKIIFHWKAQVLITVRSLRKAAANLADHTASGRSGCFEFLFWFNFAILLSKRDRYISTFLPVQTCLIYPLITAGGMS